MSQSIKNYNGKAVAECVERAATLHNLLRFLGYESAYVSSTCIIDGIEDNHAFVLLLTKNGASILDYTNPVIVLDANGKVVNYFPNEYKISPEDTAKFLKGEVISVTHQNRQKNADNTFSFVNTSTRSYKGPGEIS